MSQPTPARFETLAIHAGQTPDPTTGAVIPPIYQTSTYVQEQVGQHKGYEYSRTGNPTRAVLETCLAALEGYRMTQPVFGLAFASGMAATDTLLRLVQPGEHVLTGNDVYGGTFRLFERVLRPYGLDFTYVDMGDLHAVAAGLLPNTRMIWLETPTNPLMKISDIAGVAVLAQTHPNRPWLAVDNTFASPYLQRPLSLGADFVLHSTTKYLAGHSDVVGGGLVTSDGEAYERLKYLQNAVGAVPGPMDCFLTVRGMKTLPVRMQAHSRSAMAVARYLAAHPKVERVLYPGLAEHPGHAVATVQMCAPNGSPAFGGMLSFLHREGAEAARVMAARTRVFALAESLGGVESLIELPGVMTHASVAGSPLEVPPNLIRLSVGIEAEEDLIEDLAQALG